MKFALYDFLGRPKNYFLVNALNVDAAPPSGVAKQVGHLLFIADASGSMWGDMAALKATVEKVLTLQEYADADVYASVLSFASSGDLVTHFDHVKVSDIMAPGSRYVEEIRKLNTRGCTCISQGLAGAKKLVRAGELTAVVLLSDGYANDRSPGAEKREIDLLVEEFRTMPGVFVNTIALRDWADYKFLSYIANAASGTCFAVPSAKEVFDVLHNTTTLLAGATAPAAVYPLPTGAGYQVFASAMARKTVGSGDAGGLVIRGLKATDAGNVYQYTEVSEEQYGAAGVSVCGEGGASLDPVLAYAVAQLAEGNLNRAKYAMVTLRDETLLVGNARALVSGEIAAMSEALVGCLYGGFPKEHTFSRTYGLPNADAPSVLGILAILSEFARDVQVDLGTIAKTYKKRGVKRIAGVRQPDGTVVKPWVKTAFKSKPDWAAVSSFDLNRNNATVNMLLTRKIDLVDAGTDAVIPEVAGVPLDLTAFNYYTVVGDGILNLARIPMKIGNKRLFRRLADVGALTGDFDPAKVYDVVLEGRPLVAYDTTFSPGMLDGVFDALAQVKVLAGILNASMKGESDKYTPEQVAELKKHFLSPAMYLSLPTTTEYADLQQALADGTVDTRISYKVDFGTVDALNMGELYSANEFLARHFTLALNGVDEKKPKFDMRWQAGVQFGYKALSSRTVLNPIDDLMKPIFEDFLKLRPTASCEKILLGVGYTESEVQDFYKAAYGDSNKETAVEVMLDARKRLDAYLESVYVKCVSPLVFYVGATGLVPDEFKTKGLTADAIKAKCPNLTIGKAAMEGMFYPIGADVVLSVFSTPEYFSTGRVMPGAVAVPDEEEVA